MGAFPRLVHQVRVGDVTDSDHASVASWKQANPGFEHRLWSEAELVELIETNYPWFMETWQGLSADQKTENGRTLVLHKYGGVSAALDTRAKKGVEPLLAQYDASPKTLLIAESPYQNPFEHLLHMSVNFNRKLVTTAVEVAKPGSKPLEDALRSSKAKSDRSLKFGSKTASVKTLGGDVLKGNVVQYDENQPEVQLLPYHVFEGQAVPRSKRDSVEVYGEQAPPDHLPPVFRRMAESLDERTAHCLYYFVMLATVFVVYLVVNRVLGSTVSGLVLLMVANGLAQLLSLSNHGAYVAESKGCEGPLSDRIFDLVPQMEPGPLFNFIYTLPVYLFVGAFALFAWKDRRMLAVFLCTYLIFMFIRQTTVQLTGLPPPTDHDVLTGWLDALLDSSKTTNDEKAIRGHSDMIFSGHTGTAFLSLLFLLLYSGMIDRPAWRLALAVVMIAMVVAFEAMRLHYSVDLVLALVLSLLLFGYGRAFYEDRARTDFRGSTLFHLLLLSVATGLGSTALSFLAT